MPLDIRPARPADVAALQAIERDAAKAYVAVRGYAFCVDIPDRTAAGHARARDIGRALVLEIEDRPAGFVLVLPVDEGAHILEIAVALAHQGAGHGRRLLAAAEALARRDGFSEMTLTTYCDVPWNAPFYRRLGYEAFQPDGARPELRAIIQEEISAGVAREPRAAMKKSLARFSG